MEVKITHTDYDLRLNRKLFPDHDWLYEPDLVIGEYRGYPFLIRRVIVSDRYVSGHLAGYVGLDLKHPLAKEYDDEEVENVFDHGGTTYSEDHIPIKEFQDKFKPGLYWLGFDCAHYNDVTPIKEYTLQGQHYTEIMEGEFLKAYERLEKLNSSLQDTDRTYKTIDFVINEIKKAINKLIIKQELTI